MRRSSRLDVGLDARSASVSCDRARQDVELIVQLVEGGTGDHQLAVAELELVGALAGHPVPLPARVASSTAAAGRDLPRLAGPGGTIGSAGFPS